MQEVTLVPMTKDLCRLLYKEFETDPDIYMDMSLYKKFEYSECFVDYHFKRQLEKRRAYFAIMQDGEVVGEVTLKEIDEDKHECSLSIHLQNNSRKGQGIGTQAERLALKYAFCELNMLSVNADTVRKNTRSQHVLEKVGFRFIREEGIFRYYRYDVSEFLSNSNE